MKALSLFFVAHIASSLLLLFPLVFLMDLVSASRDRIDQREELSRLS